MYVCIWAAGMGALRCLRVAGVTQETFGGAQVPHESLGKQGSEFETTFESWSIPPLSGFARFVLSRLNAPCSCVDPRLAQGIISGMIANLLHRNTPSSESITYSPLHFCRPILLIGPYVYYSTSRSVDCGRVVVRVELIERKVQRTGLHTKTCCDVYTWQGGT